MCVERFHIITPEGDEAVVERSLYASRGLKLRLPGTFAAASDLRVRDQVTDFDRATRIFMEADELDHSEYDPEAEYHWLQYERRRICFGSYLIQVARGSWFPIRRDDEDVPTHGVMLEVFTPGKSSPVLMIAINGFAAEGKEWRVNSTIHDPGFWIPELVAH